MIHLQQFPIETLHVNRIIPDEKFILSDRGPDDKLKSSIAGMGLITPLVVQKAHNQFRLVCGYKRYTCIKNSGMADVPCYVVPEEIAYVDLLKLAIHENRTIRDFTPVEISAILFLAQKYGDMKGEEIIDQVIPLLGFGKNPKIYDLYAPLRNLSDEWKRALENELVPPETAFLMNGVNQADQGAFLRLIETLRLGRNRQREFWALLADVARLQEKSVSDLLSGEEIRAVMEEEKLTHSQKTERLKELLWHWRYPKYSETRDRFEAILAEAKLPPDIHLQPPAYFEGERFQVSFGFVSAKDFEEKIAILSRLHATGLADKMVKLV